MKKILKLNLLLFVLGFVFVSSSALANTLRTTKPGYFAAITEEAFEQALDLQVAGDNQALQSMFDSKMVFMLKEGLSVYITKWTWTGKIKIRPKGTTLEVWTFAEAVTDD